MELLEKAAGIAHRVAGIISPPQGRDGSAAVVAGNHDGGSWSRHSQCTDINGSSGVIDAAFWLCCCRRWHALASDEA